LNESEILSSLDSVRIKDRVERYRHSADLGEREAFAGSLLDRLRIRAAAKKEDSSMEDYQLGQRVHTRTDEEDAKAKKFMP